MVRIELSKKRKILLISILVSWILILFGILSGDKGVIGNIIILSVLIIAIPQLIFNYISYREIKETELYYPVFLRDLVEATKAGLPLHKAIISVGNTNYGALTKEVKKMADQLSWNVNLINVLEQSKKRLGKNPVLTKIIRIMIETYKSGGSVADTLNSLSDTLSTIQETQKERESLLKQYVIAVYAISFVFIGIIVAINKLMVPIFETMAGGFSGGPVGVGSSSPCITCLYGGGIECMPCSIYFNICSILGVDKTRVSCYYMGLFFSMSIIQAITGGLVAGQIGEGSTKAGIKHSLILFTITCGAFFILVKLKLMGV